ncbi:MAG: hypothetical protein JWP47_284 [Polaromonas sp.]|nr:hypothetical protein [Polaromonas sp.]
MPPPGVQSTGSKRTRTLVRLLELAGTAGGWTYAAPNQLSLTQGLNSLLGLPPEAQNLPAEPFADTLFSAYSSSCATPYASPVEFFAPPYQQSMASALAACLADGQPFDMRAEVITASGRRFWVRSLGEALRDATGRIVQVQGVLRDLSDTFKAEPAASHVAIRLSTTLDSISEAFVTLDRKGRFTYANRESLHLLDAREADILGQRITDHLDKVNSRLHREIRLALASGKSVEFEEFYAALGKWLEVRAYPFEDGVALYLRDMTERKAAKDEIEHLAFYDALTQLPNRQLLMDRLGRAQDEIPPHGAPAQSGALMFIDLDHFKVLNDTLGHAKGDLLLQQAAVRLSGCVQATDTVARLGGDEFVIMLDSTATHTQDAELRAHAVGQQVLAALSEPYDLAGYEHHATCSIGVTIFSGHGFSIGELLKQADLAMYEAKAAGRNTLCFFNPRMQATATANAALNIELRQGLRNQNFALHYQPQVARDGRMSGVEALLRWQHPRRGLVYPKEFIAQAEESGLILPLGKWVLDSACRQLALWSGRPETEGLSIAVNVSARQFRHPEFVDLVMNAIGEAGVKARRLKLELTESLLATHIDVTIAKMGVLKEAGVTLSIDDFGMGYSGLSYLKRLPLDQLKIDRSFIKDVLTDPNDAAIARTIIGLAQSLGLDILAEGVETEAQRELLVRFGCERYQGYLFCQPLPIDELERFMRKLPKTAVTASITPCQYSRMAL